jgi:hypothetical protein
VDRERVGALGVPARGLSRCAVVCCSTLKLGLEFLGALKACVVDGCSISSIELSLSFLASRFSPNVVLVLTKFFCAGLNGELLVGCGVGIS